MAAEMKALIKEAPVKGYDLKVIPVPEIGDDEVLFKVEKVAICGSDIALYAWNEVAQLIASLPFIPGHEAAGEVIKVGSSVANLKVGDRIAIENHFFCGNCYSCKNDRGDICKNMSQYGHGKGTTQGGFSQFSAVKAKYCYPLKTNISWLDAVLLEPLGVAYNGVSRINVKDQDVLVTGAGPIGLFSAAVAKALGAARVIVADVNPKRLQLAKEMGADLTINSKEVDLKDEIMRITQDDGMPRLVEASGASEVVNNCFKLLQKGAQLVLIGLHRKPLHVEDFPTDILFKSITLHTVHGRRIFDTWTNCEQLIASGAINPKLIVSHEFHMSDWQTAFDVLLSGEGCKIVIDPQQ